MPRQMSFTRKIATTFALATLLIGSAAKAEPQNSPPPVRVFPGAEPASREADITQDDIKQEVEQTPDVSKYRTSRWR